MQVEKNDNEFIIGSGLLFEKAKVIYCNEKLNGDV